ncbi:MAG: amidase [Candidatus Aminicenantes bacterium]|nr:amidase [Candidatus Aminicenantes bacterium]
MNDYIACDATELAARVRRGEVQPAELVETAIAAIETVNPALNAVMHPMYDAARAAVQALPDGPFRGVPMVVKDHDGFVKGTPHTSGTCFLEGFVPDHDSEAMARLRRAGLVFVAKTNLPELAILGTTEGRLRGPARNPWNPGHSTGGSSGGSAALVASRAVPLGHGGDGGGSLRIPASACGLVGFKTTRGRVTMAPDFGEDWGGYTSWGCLTRSVRDAAALIDVMAGPAPGDPYTVPPLVRPLVAEVGAPPAKLRVAFTAGSLFGKGTHPECRAAVESAVRLLADLGHDVEEARPEFDRGRQVRAYVIQIAASVASEIETMGRWVGRKPSPAYFEPSTWFLYQIGRRLSAAELQQARDAGQTVGRSLAAFFSRYDLFVTPTLAYPPVRLGEMALKPIEAAALAALRVLPVGAALRAVLAQLADTSLERTPNTQLFNQTGQPAVSLPLYQTPEGLPIGVQFIARYAEEPLLVRVAAQIEEARPWKDRLPKIVAP